MKRIVSICMIGLIMLSTMLLALNIHPVRASGTIYIRADGSIDPPDAPISTSDYVTYSLTSSITSDADGIVLGRDNMILDGAGYTLQGTGGSYPTGITLDGRTNVTVKNIQVMSFYIGIFLRGYTCRNNTITANIIRENSEIGIYGNHGPCFNSISDNTISHNFDGVNLYVDCNSTSISGNTITDNSNRGIEIAYSRSNNVSGNNIANNGEGVCLRSSSGATVYHNNFIDNSQQVGQPSVSSWDDGYPSGGNYWSDYVGTDQHSGPGQDELGSDGIGDTPYVINVDNQDNYPLMEPWSPPTAPEIGEPRGVFIRLGQLLAMNSEEQVSMESAIDSIRAFVSEVESNNLNAVYVGFKDDCACYDYDRVDHFAYGILMYNSTLARTQYPDKNLVYGPVQRLLTTFDFDPMENLVSELKAGDVEVHAWLPVFQDRLAITELGLAAQPVGTSIPNATDPRDSDVRNYNLALISEIVQTYDVDGVNLDYIRCDEKADWPYKLDHVQDVVSFVVDVRALTAPLVLSADVFPDDVWSTIWDYGQDYVEISRHVDATMPMTYFAHWGEDPSWVGERVSHFRSQVYSPYIVPIIQAYTNGGTYDVTAQDVVDAVDAARTSEADGFSWFTYIHIRDELGGLEGICQSVCQQPALCSWKIAASIATDEESYWLHQPNIVFSGGFAWKGSAAPLASSTLVIQIRNPLGIWADDLEISTQTTSEGVFVSQLTAEWMMLGTWTARAKDTTYGSAGVTTFEVTLLPGDLLFMAFSPVDLHIYDSRDRHVGVNGTGGIDLEIPGAVYSGADGESEWILVPNAPPETFRARLAGTGTGNYTFIIIYVKNETATIEESFNGLVEPGANRTFSAHISGEDPAFFNWHASGDVDGDWDVDIFDIVIIAGGYGTLPPDPGYDLNCDIDGDGDIDIFDLVQAAVNYGKSW